MNKITKRILSSFLCCALLLSLTACSGDGETTDAVSSADAATEAATDAETLPPEETDGVVTVLAAGDNLVHEAVYKDALARGRKNPDKVKRGEYYFAPMYDDVKDVIASADLAIINQESQICGEGYEASGYPAFCTPVEMGKTLMDLGFNAIVTANNHMLDMDDEGLVGTYNYWKDKPVIQVGIDLSSEEGMDIAVFEKEGIKIALLAYTDVLNGSTSQSDYAGYTYYNSHVAEKQIKKAKEVADIVIVSMHWGEENTFDVNSSQKSIAKHLTRCGVDVILGHHPHVVQSVEWIEAGGNKTLCVYSLGNFLSTMTGSYNMVGMMFGFDVVSENGDVYVTNVKVIPTVTYYTKSRDGVCVYLMENYTRFLSVNHGCNNPSDEETFRSYITDNIDEEFLPDYLK